MLGYPLRALFVHEEWHPALACLAGGDWVPWERIAAAMPAVTAEALENFLNTLIRKGYLAQEGFPRLAESDYPSVSVIIPVRNRPQEIRECLASLTRLELDHAPPDNDGCPAPNVQRRKSVSIAAQIFLDASYEGIRNSHMMSELRQDFPGGEGWIASLARSITAV